MSSPQVVSGSPTAIGGSSSVTSLNLTMAQNVNTSSTTNGVLLRLFLNLTTAQTIQFSDPNWVALSPWSTTQTIGIYFRPNQPGDTNNLGTVSWTTSVSAQADLEEYAGVNLQSPSAGNGYLAGASGSATYNAPTPNCSAANATAISSFATAFRTAISSIAAGWTQLSNNLGSNNQTEAQYDTTPVALNGSAGGSVTFGGSSSSKVFSVTQYLAPMPVPSVNPATMTFSTPTSAAQQATVTGGTAPYSVQSSSNGVATATISGGTVTVTPVGPGNCTITITDAQQQTCTINVSVGNPAPTAITVSPSSITFTNPIARSQNVGISGGVPPYLATVSSSNGAVATGVQANNIATITPRGAGTAVLTVTDSQGTQASVNVDVLNPGRKTVEQLIQEDSQMRYLQVQVYRNGNWITIPVDSASATIGKGTAGAVTLMISNDDTDALRSQLWEGDFIRMYRGVVGNDPIRSWTGFVDDRQPVDSGAGIQRQVTVTDYIKELNDAIVINGMVYDGWDPSAACADIIQQGINTGQLVFRDDNFNVLSSTANFEQPEGNSICYFPQLFNDDGTPFVLASGTLGSFSAPLTGINAQFQIPVASNGANYSTFELPNRYLIASTMSMPGFHIASVASSFPPASGTVYMDTYNGILYFASSQASQTATINGVYYDPPLFDNPPGTKIGDVVSQIMDNVGCRWGVDAYGKFYSVYIDSVQAPTRILNKGQYIQNGVEINRDRRNVIVCLGWDGNCGGILAAKAVNTNDIDNPPPQGLGKRTYLIVQNKQWSTMYAVFKAAYYAVQQIGRRGKVVSISLLDDPTIDTLETIFCFESTIPEIGMGDFFYAEQIQWQYQTQENGGMSALMNVSGSMLPGQGLMYCGPISGVTEYGSLDLTADVECISNAYLTPAGGTFASTFSIAAGLELTYTIGAGNGVESVDIYGSDGSHIVGDNNFARGNNQTLTLALPTNKMTAGVMYVIRLWFLDEWGNVGVYRDFITARP